MDPTQPLRPARTGPLGAGRWRRVVVAVELTLLFLLGARSVSAEPAVRVAVAPLTGDPDGRIRAAVLRALAARPEVELLSTSASLSPPEFEESAVSGGARAFVVGAVERRRRRWRAELSLVHVASGATEGVAKLRAPSPGRLEKVIEAKLWARLGASIEAAPGPRPPRTLVLGRSSGPERAMEHFEAALSAVPWLTLRAPTGPSSDSADARARSADADAWLELEVDRGPSGWTAQMVLTRADGAAHRSALEAGSLPALEVRTVEALAPPLAQPLRKIVPAPKPAPPPRTPALAASESRSPSARPELEAIYVSAGLGVLGRDFGYAEDRSGGLRGYSLGGAPAVELRARWFPAAHFTDGPLTWIGVEAEGRLGLGLSSSHSSGERFPTDAYAFFAGLRGRLPLDEVRIGLSLGGGVDAFSFGAAEDGSPPGIPSAEYGYLGAQLDGRLDVAALLFFEAAARLRSALSVGQLSEADWFPEASALGLGGSLGAGVQLSSALEVRLEGRLDHWSVDLGPEREGLPSAVSAHDVRWGLTVGAALRI